MDPPPHRGQVSRVPAIAAMHGTARAPAVRAAATRPGAVGGNVKQVGAVQRDRLDAAARHGTKLVHVLFYGHDRHLPQASVRTRYDPRKARENHGNQGGSASAPRRPSPGPARPGPSPPTPAPAPPAARAHGPCCGCRASPQPRARCSGEPSRAASAGPRRTPWFDDPPACAANSRGCPSSTMARASKRRACLASSDRAAARSPALPTSLRVIATDAMPPTPDRTQGLWTHIRSNLGIPRVEVKTGWYYCVYSMGSAPCRDPIKARGVPEGSTVQISRTMWLCFFGAIVR